MENNYRLPKDLNESLKNLEDAIIPSLLDSNKRFTIEFNFEGLKFNRIGITIYKILSKNNNVFITFADQGAVALAQRDYPCLLYTSPSPRDATTSRMPSSA